MLLGLLASCAAETAQDIAIDRLASQEIANHPSYYTNGESRSFLVTRNGQVHGFIWGSIHIGSGAQTQLAPDALRYLARAVDVTAEIRLQTLSGPDWDATISQYVKWLTTPSVDAVSRLDPATRRVLAETLPIDAPKRLSLRGLAVFARAKALGKELSTTSLSAPMDVAVQTFAMTRGITVRELDTRATTLGLIRLAIGEDPNGPEAVAALRSALENRIDIPWVFHHYGLGQVARVAAGLTAMGQGSDSADGFADHKLAIFHDRNLAWIPRLESTFEEPGIHFVVFGAGHLVGDDGVVALLRSRGWQVSPCAGDFCPAL